MVERGADRRILIVGIGNQFRGDDALGFAVIKELQGTLPANIEMREFEGDGVALMQLWQGYDTVILTDCVVSGAAVGTLFRLDPLEQRMPARFFRSSSHLFGIAEAVEMARALNQLPAKIIIFGVEGSGFDAGTAMSPPVAKAVDLIANQIRVAIHNL